jgi:insulysin
MSDERIRFSF